MEFFIKKFKWETIAQGKSFVPMDDKTIELYMKSKIEIFSNSQNYRDTTKLYALFDEIDQMCNYDIKTASIDGGNLRGMRTELLDDAAKRNAIFCYNYIIILGSIFYNVFDAPGNKIISFSGGQHGAIETSKMAEIAYNELLCFKQKNKKDSAYGSTLIFATLIESTLKTKLYNFYVVKAIKDLQNKTASSAILSSDDEKLLNYLNDTIILSKKNDDFDPILVSKKLAYNLFIENNIWNKNNKDLKKLMRDADTFTFNQIINSTLIKENLNEKLVNFLKNIFAVKNLNLRNNLAHCSYGHFNYYNISTTSLLFVIFEILLREDVLI